MRNTGLHDVLIRRQNEVLGRWVEHVRSAAKAPSPTLPGILPPSELVGHLAEFLDELASAVARNGAARPSTGRDHKRAAAEHGLCRFRSGFDVGALVRDYGILRQCIVEIAREEETALNAEEDRLLADGITMGLAAAATEHALQREAQVQRCANEQMAYVAHELRNPLSSASLAVASLESKGLFPKHRFVSVLARSLTRMTLLLDKSLQFASLGAGIERKMFDLSELLAEAVAAVVESEEKGVTVEVVGAAFPGVLGDRGLLEIALVNLVRNAVKFTPAGGTIRLCCTETDGAVRVDVADECGGIPPDKVDRVFLPFCQLDKGKGGFGLGLPVAKQAAEAHGGSLRVRSTPGKGCVFTLVIPSSP